MKPEDLGTISDDGLFVAGDEVGQGTVKAFVEIDGLTLHAAANVIVSPPATGAITGNVINDNGSVPLEGAKVKAIRLGKIHWVQKAVTNSEGKYLVGDLIPGDYVLYAKAKGFIGEFYDDTRNYLEATVLRIAEEDTLTDKDFGLSEGGKITGTVVTDDSNLPIAKAHVVAFLRLKPRFARHVLTADDGSYIIEALPKGTYVAKANAAGYKGEYYNDVEHFSEAALLNVEEGESIDDVNFGLATASAIRGVVTNAVDGSPIAGARIRAFLAPIIALHPRIFKETRTNENGEYILQIRPGFYYVLASAEGFNSEFYDDARNIKDAALVQVFPDSHTVDIGFGLMPRGSISGIVTKQGTDIPIEGAVVEAFRENSTVDVASTLAGYRAKTDASGKYTIEDVPSGNYLIRTVAEGYLPEFYPEKPTKEGATLVEVKDGTDVENIDFTLEPGGSISGLVASEKDSLPIARALVQVWGANVRLHRRTYSQNDGNYKIGGLPTGKYLVQVIAAGYFSEFYKDARRQRDATLVPVEAPAETHSIDFYLKPFA
ncbi:MAG: collagen binding domain-containing protein, partial [bacterium]